MNSSEISFNVADLRIVLQILNVVSARGAIKANEMSMVGDVYDRISKFIENIDKTVQPAPSADGAERGEDNG